MDAIISAVITPLIDAIIKPLFRELGYLFSSGANVRNLEKTSQELNRRKDEVREEIVRAGAESDEIVPTREAKEWMGKVQTMEDEVISKVVEDYKRPKACPTACNCWLSYKIGKRAEKAVIDVEELTRKQFPVTKRCPPPIRRMPTLSEVTPLSTGEYLEEAIDYIQRDDVGMVGIWGMGGVGKTTLLRKINNHPSVAAVGFEFVIWLVASQDLNLDRLRKDIAKRLGVDDEGLQVETLYRYLKGKSFLLLLDDIWEPFDLTNGIGIPLPHHSDGVTPKRKIVFTTRSQAVCGQMMARSQASIYGEIKINCLLPEEAWKLFLHNVGEGMRSIIDSDSNVLDRARKVADKCGGLPLALEVIARAMSANQTWREWENAINHINTIGIQGINGADPFPLLKISYDRLPDDCTKNCFLSCALWPEDHEIRVSELIDCWWAMNLIDYYGDINITYNSGYAIVQRLKRACLLEQVEGDFYSGNQVKMHDILRDMALWIVSSQKKWVVKNRDNLGHWSEAEIIWLSHDRSGVLPQHPACPNLSSLILSSNYVNIKVIPEGFFKNMPVLTFLDLSHTGISELPRAIGRLRQLRHLNLNHTGIRSLPMELENLAELKVLLVNWVSFHFIMPQGLLSKFQKLGHLGMIGGDFMEELGSSTITSLDCRFRRIETVEGLAKNPSISLRFLEIEYLMEETTLSLSSLLWIGNTRSTLSRLEIRYCDDLENITISNQCEEEVFHNLEYFKLSDMRVLKKITSSTGSPFRNIRLVEIDGCRELRSATWILQYCPRIVTLTISRCHKMEHVIGNKEGAEDGSGDEIEALGGGNIEQSENSMLFSHLTYLTLEHLPKLRSFSTHEIGFPSLKDLYLVALPKLCSFSTREIGFPSLKNVLIRMCPLLDETPFSHREIARSYSSKGGTTAYLEKLIGVADVV